jgi:hypothetical protein
MLIFTATGLFGCSDSREKQFLLGCANLGNPDGQCSCIYEVASSNLNEEQFVLFSAYFLKDEPRAAKAQAKLGIMSGAAAAAKIAWVGANTEKACPR